MKKTVLVNPAQLMAIQANKVGLKKHIYLEWGRGTGKSTILGWYLKECVRQMPRSTGIIVGETYQQILSRTLPSTKEGMEMFGLFEGIDYVVGKSGASLGFELPFQSPSRWNNVIHFRNGAIAILVSLDMPDAGRGINSYWVIGDEAALLNQERLFNNVQTTNRAKKTFFEKSTLLNAEIFASSTAMTRRGKWFTDMEKVAMKKPSEYSFIKANAFVNKKNLDSGWFKKMEDNAPSQIHYDAEILNIRPPAVLNAFYIHWQNKIHTYGNSYDINLLDKIGTAYISKIHDNCSQDRDLIKGKQLEISIDPGKKINSMSVWQCDYIANEERCIKEFFVIAPHDWEELVAKFDEYYSDQKRSCNTIQLRHDVSAYKERDQNNKTIAEKIEAKLRALNWRVINRTPNTNNPGHTSKFTVLNSLLKRRDKRLPKILINKDNCPNMVISIENAETTIKENSYAKDKSSERDQALPQEYATHLSDTFDYHLYWKYFERVLSTTELPAFFSNF